MASIENINVSEKTQKLKINEKQKSQRWYCFFLYLQFGVLRRSSAFFMNDRDVNKMKNVIFETRS